MPHISKRKLTKEVKDKLEKQIMSVIADTGDGRRMKIFSELFTPTEKIVFAKRLAIILMLSKKIPFYTICGNLGVSPSTVARYEVQIENNKFHSTKTWLMRNEMGTKLNNLLELLVASAFGRGRKSFGQMIDDV